MVSPLEVQVGGAHYKKYKIQPIVYAMENGLDACQTNVVKYITRFRDKDGVKDLLKAKHYIDVLIELEQPKSELHSDRYVESPGQGTTETTEAEPFRKGFTVPDFPPTNFARQAYER